MQGAFSERLWIGAGTRPTESRRFGRPHQKSEGEWPARSACAVLSSSEEFESDEAAEACVFGLVDHAHTSTAEPFSDVVMRDGLPD
jgi:hypothetical protein